MTLPAPRGLRGRLAVGTMTLLVTAIAVTDITAFVSLRAQLEQRNESFLELSLRRGLTLAQTPGIDWTPSRLERILPANSYFAIYDSSGGLLLEQVPASSTGLTLPSVPPLADLPAGTTLIADPGEQEGIVVQPRSLPAGMWSPITVNGVQHEFGGVVAGVTNAEDIATLRSLVAVQAWSGLLIIAFALITMWLILLVALRPLRDVAVTAREISGGDRSRRVPVTDERTEIGAVSLALNEAFDHVEASEARMRTFVADASHELRTPLSAVLGWADLYLHNGMREWDEVDVAMTRIRLESARMKDLIDQLLTLARLEVQPSGEREPVDVGALCADVIASLEVTAPGHHLELIARESPIVLGDPITLRQAVANIVGNAIRHTPAGTSVVVLVEPEPDGSAIRLAVSDDGPGLTDEQLEHAFDRFWRASDGRGPSGGTGLGLAIVRAVALAHSGTATLDSAVGEGLTVTLRIPAHTEPATR